MNKQLLTSNSMIKYLFTFLIIASSFVLQAKNGFYGIINENGMGIPDSMLLLNEDSVVVNLPD